MRHRIPVSIRISKSDLDYIQYVAKRLNIKPSEIVAAAMHLGTEWIKRGKKVVAS